MVVSYQPDRSTRDSRWVRELKVLECVPISILPLGNLLASHAVQDSQDAVAMN